MRGLSGGAQGKDAVAFVESLVVGDVQALKDGTGSLSVMTNDAGGIIDDTVITKVSSEEIYMVLNAGCRDKDLEHINKHLAAFKGARLSRLSAALSSAVWLCIDLGVAVVGSSTRGSISTSTYPRSRARVCLLLLASARYSWLAGMRMFAVKTGSAGRR